MSASTQTHSGVDHPEHGAKRRTRPEQWVPYVMLLPAALFLLVMQGGPLLRQVQMSFSKASLLRPNDLVFTGLDNFRALFADPRFTQTVMVTLVYVVVCVAGTIILGLAVALILNQKFPGRPIARALMITPWAVPPVAVALVVTWMLNPDYGIINRVLRFFGFEGRAWLNDPEWALPAILVATLWQLFPFTSLVLLAALQSVNHELIEAAVMDGAGPWHRFWAVAWPAIRPTVALLTILMTIWSLKRFELIWLMTQGGPTGSTNTLVIDLYRRAFQFNQLGSAAAVGIIGCVVALGLMAVYFVIERRTAR